MDGDVAISAIKHFKEGAIDLTAGTLGGVANVYAGQPLDTVKVKVQIFPHLHRNWVSCLKETYRLDGIKGLYAGTVPALVANIVDNAIVFTAYGYCKKAVGLITGHDRKNMTPLESASAGALASLFAAVALCPTELVKCRLQSAREVGIHCTPFSVCGDMWREKGIRGFFVGMTPTLAREVPGYFCFFGAYDTSRHFFAKKGQHKDDIGLLKTAASGAIGGMALWAAVYPFDSIKSRMQVTGGNFFSLLVQTARNEGIQALYKGLLPTLIRTCLASASLFVTYEESSRLMKSFFNQKEASNL